MIVRSSLASVSLAALAALLLGACASAGPGSDAEPADDLEASEDALGASCTYSRKWFVTLKDRVCEPVAGYRGTWVPSALFDGDDATTCTYSWVGERYSRADQRALERTAREGEGFAPACGPGRHPIEGELLPIEQLDALGMAGSVGCDVCGILKGRNDRINVILPPGLIVSKQLEVKLSNGQSRAFQLKAPEGARAVSFALPPPPAGTSYVSSKVTVY